ncbi:MAG: hypothetical protein ACQEWW_07790 [Bacillota bacterium]
MQTYLIEFKDNGVYLIHYTVSSESLREAVLDARESFRNSWVINKETASAYIYTLNTDGTKTYVGRN